MSAMRTALWHILAGSSEFTSVVPVNRVYETSAYGVSVAPSPQPTDGAFALISTDATEPGVGVVDRCHVSIAIYDRAGDYGNIDRALKAVRNAVFSSVPGYWGDPGIWVLGAEWEGDMAGAWDDGLRAIYREGNYVLIGAD